MQKNKKLVKKQKYRYIRLFTFLGLVAVLSLQAAWIYNTYMLIRNNIQKDCCEVVEKTLENEMVIRMDNLPEGSQVIGGEVNDTIKPLTYFCENLSNMGREISMVRIDSIASALLKEYSIESNFVVCTMNPQNDSILQVSKKENLSLWGVIKFEPFLIKSDSTEAVQLLLINPYKVFFERMGLLMIASFIMLVLVIGCIIYQIKVIIYQKKVAKLREDFSYAMIHDMKTPLSSIMMCSDALNDEKIESMPELKKSFLGVVKSETVHLLKLINRLLTISKLENDKLTMVKEKVKLEPMLERIRETFKAKSTKPLHFTLNLQAKEVNADKEYLEEAVYNLVDNAVKYSKDEGEVEIEITSECSGGYSCIKVRDNGIGFSEEDKRKIFDKFERGSAIKSSRLGKVAGFGLGLNYVYRVMEAHGGTVTASSVVGKFSEFTLYMSASEEEDTENKMIDGKQN